jgi:hypothetical protein
MSMLAAGQVRPGSSHSIIRKLPLTYDQANGSFG